MVRPLEVWEAQPSGASRRLRMAAHPEEAEGALVWGLFQWAVLGQLFKEQGQAHKSSCPLTTGWGQRPQPDPHCLCILPSLAQSLYLREDLPASQAGGVLTPLLGPSIPGSLH